jgi:hypothetical protein
MVDDDPWAARAGWSLTSERIARSPEGLDLPALLERIELEMAGAAPEAQWTMNFCLAGIRIHFPTYRKRAIATGEALGLYRDYPVSKRLYLAFRTDLDQRDGEPERLIHPARATDSGFTFWLTRKKLVGSYFLFTSTSRA